MSECTQPFPAPFQRLARQESMVAALKSGTSLASRTTAPGGRRGVEPPLPPRSASARAYIRLTGLPAPPTSGASFHGWNTYDGCFPAASDHRPIVRGGRLDAASRLGSIDSTCPASHSLLPYRRALPLHCAGLRMAQTLPQTRRRLAQVNEAKHFSTHGFTEVCNESHGSGTRTAQAHAEQQYTESVSDKDRACGIRSPGTAIQESCRLPLEQMSPRLCEPPQQASTSPIHYRPRSSPVKDFGGMARTLPFSTEAAVLNDHRIGQASCSGDFTAYRNSARDQSSSGTEAFFSARL